MLKTFAATAVSVLAWGAPLLAQGAAPAGAFDVAQLAAGVSPTAQPGAQPLDNPIFRWRDHPSLRFGRGLRIDFLLKLQYDVRDPGDEPVEFDELELRRSRVGIEGEIFNRIQFALERELSKDEVDEDETDAADSPWKDVYLDVNFTDTVQVRGGRFKVPFGLEQNIGITNLDFAYRTRGSTFLTPGRDTGLMAHGRFFDRGLNYWVGYFEQDGDNARSRRVVGADETFAARVTAMPFRRVRGLGNAEIGGALAISALDDLSELPNGLRSRTVISEYVFFEPVYVKGRRTRYEADIDWAAGPFGARAELISVLDTREDQGLSGQTLPDARARAWYVSGMWVLTGEDKERPVEPRRPLPPSGVGAFELAVRFERIYFDSVDAVGQPFRNPRAETIYPNGSDVFTAGINWYVNRFVKLQVNAVREDVDDVERSPTAGGEPFWSTLFRMQLIL